jgi:RNA polymerase sigma-70 factor, ECF subfamily
LSVAGILNEFLLFRFNLLIVLFESGFNDWINDYSLSDRVFLQRNTEKAQFFVRNDARHAISRVEIKNATDKRQMNKQQQDEIFNRWLNLHRGLVSKVARSFAAESNDRADLFQEIAFQIWKSIPRYRDEVAESTWIYRVALYTAISWSRKESKRQERSQEMASGEAVVDQSIVDPQVEWLYEKIAEFEPIDRSLTLLLLDGFSYREMSDTLGISESNVGVRINRIKKQLANQLQREKKHGI